MKENLLISTQNVQNALKGITYLRNRPVSEMVGLGLIWGPPGTGKTRFTRNYAINHNACYIRLDAVTTAKSFAVDLHRELCSVYNLPATQPRGNASKLFQINNELLNNITAQYGAPLIFVDEVDYAFRNKQLLGEIRDMADETIAIIILIGMNDAKNELLKANAHYFDRCSYFVNFKNLSLDDVKIICTQMLDIEITPQLVSFIYQRTAGTFRKLVKTFYAIETIASCSGLKKVDLQDVANAF